MAIHAEQKLRRTASESASCNPLTLRLFEWGREECLQATPNQPRQVSWSRFSTSIKCNYHDTNELSQSGSHDLRHASGLADAMIHRPAETTVYPTSAGSPKPTAISIAAHPSHCDFHRHSIVQAAGHGRPDHWFTGSWKKESGFVRVRSNVPAPCEEARRWASKTSVASENLLKA